MFVIWGMFMAFDMFTRPAFEVIAMLFRLRNEIAWFIIYVGPQGQPLQPVTIVEGDIGNFKVTYSADLERAAALLRQEANS